VINLDNLINQETAERSTWPAGGMGADPQTRNDGSASHIRQNFLSVVVPHPVGSVQQRTVPIEINAHEITDQTGHVREHVLVSASG
jgi:hypothetical protein